MDETNCYIGGRMVRVEVVVIVVICCSHQRQAVLRTHKQLLRNLYQAPSQTGGWNVTHHLNDAPIS